MTVGRDPMPVDVHRGVVKWLLQAALGGVGYGFILFLAAGRLDWGWGWRFWVILMLMLAAHPILLIPINPALLAERQKGTRAAGVKYSARRVPPATGRFRRRRMDRRRLPTNAN